MAHRKSAQIRRRPVRGARAVAFGALLLITIGSTVATETPSLPDDDDDLAMTLAPERFHSPDDQLRELIAIQLEENPQIESSWARSNSLLQRVPQEKALPDPLLTYRYFARSPETRIGPQQHGLEISQVLPWSGKRASQASRAASLAAGSTWEAADLERSLVARLKYAYFEVAYLQEALAVNSEERELLRRFERIALKRYATGHGIQQHVVKVQTDISRLEDHESKLRLRLAAEQRRIAELTGRPETGLVLRRIELPLPNAGWEPAELERAAVSDHPRVHAMERRIEADRTWAERRKLEGRPDFRLGLGYVSVGDREDQAGVLFPPEENGKDIVALSVGINIPIFRKRIRAGVAEAQESARANTELLLAVRDRLRLDVQDALLRMDSLFERAVLYRDLIVPQAEESLASAEAAYATDRLGFIDLLDAERILFQSRLAYHRLVSDLWIVHSDLERAVAGSARSPS